jgi:hypothetical protein
MAQLLESRADAESLMLDACAIVRPGGTVTDPNTGETSTPSPTVYTGKAKVQTYEAQESNPEAGGATMTVQRYTLHIPVGSYAPEVGDVATITAAAADTNLVGRKYRVVALLHKSLTTAYRLGVEEDV